MSEIYWQQGAWLALIPLPWLLSWLWPGQQGRSRLTAFIHPRLWKYVLSPANQQQQRRGNYRLLAIWTLLCLALAGPGILSYDHDSAQRRAANIVFILDISPSMGAKDVSPSRLRHSQTLLRDFVQSLSPHRLALIAFSANAYTVQGLSHDHGAFVHFLDSLDPSLVSVTGSNLAQALRLTRQTLDEHSEYGGLAVLISDGEIHDSQALDEARQLAAAGHRLYTLGVGTEQGAPVPLAGGRLVRQQGKLHVSQRQTANLQALARAADGQYQDLSPQAWPLIQQQIDALQQSIYQFEIRRHGGQPLFPLLIIAALLLLFWHGLQRPQGLALLIVGITSLQITPSDAAPWTEAEALQQLQNREYQSAIKTYSQLENYTGYLGLGVAAYELADWPRARDAFKQAYDLADGNEEKARAAYNLGNSLSQLGELDSARAAFQQALLWQADFPAARHNLRLLKQAEATALAAQAEQDKDSSTTSLLTDNAPGEEQAGQTAPTTQETGQQGPDARQANPDALREVLKAWSQNQPLPTQTPARVWQQFRHLREESQTILMRRFEIEDKQAAGLVETKPW